MEKCIKRFLTILICICFYSSQGQPNDFEFLVSKIKNDYAGYYDKTDNAKFDKYVKRIMSAKSSDTFKILSQLTSFFNDQHLQLYAVDALDGLTFDSVECSKNLNSLREFYLDSKKKKDNKEGYWVNEQRSIIIFIKKNSSDSYNAFLVDSKKSRVPRGFTVAEIQRLKGSKFLTYFISPKVGGRLCLRSEFTDSGLITGDIAKWKKIQYPYDNNLLDRPSLFPTSPSGISLSESTYLITIPSFAGSNKYIVDSIVRTDSQKIVSSKNFIIDIRNNTGGTVQTYASLLPFIYTKPIFEVSGYTRCTPDLVSHRQELIDKYLKGKSVDSLVLKELYNDLTKAKQHLGTFFFEAGDTFKMAYVSAMPKNVAIITNFACQSAAEMMVLDFKQSNKVTTFGEHTMGAVDYLNAYTIELPSKKYLLKLATVKRAIPIGKKKLDGIGIKPDVSIPNKIDDWVKFVQQYYE